MLLSTKVMAIELSGTLVLNTGPQIETLDLKTLERRVVLKDQWPSELAKIDNNSVLMASDSNIRELDLKTITVKKIRKGYYPQYVPEHRKLFFMAPSISGKDQLVIFITNINEPEKAEEIEMPPNNYKYGFSQTPVFQVSHDEVIFIYDQKVWVYNIATRTVNKFQVENCLQPMALRNTTGQLLCGDYLYGSKRGREFLVDLNGGSTEEVPRLATHYPVLYLSKFDVLVTFKKRLKLFPILKLGETADLWVYSFKDGSETLLKKNIWTQPFGTVWVE